MSDVKVGLALLDVVLDEAAPPVDVAEIQLRAQSAPVLPDAALRRVRPGWVAVAAAAAVLVIGMPLLVFGVASSSPVAETPGTTAVEPTTTILKGTSLSAPFALGGIDGTWERTVFEGGFIVEDLHATSFGLVAAAGPEGVWISADGTEWDQVLGTDWPEALAPPNSAPADPATSTTVLVPMVGLMSAETVVEYRNALYAFGYEIKDPEEAPSSVVWRSSDGQVWDKTPIDDFPQVMAAVAGPDALFLVGRDVDPGQGDDETVVLSTVIFRSTDGKEFAAVNTSGLEGFVVWAISRFGDGYFALGEKWLDRGAVLASPDGVIWEEVGPWAATRPDGQAQPMNYSVWALVDLFEGPYGLVTVGSPESFNPQGSAPETRPRIMIATSIDGETFVEMDDQTQLFQLEDQRDEIWPPLRPPQGTIVGNQIMLLGYSYPDNTGEPAYYQWIWSPRQR